jgi:hypothetical protein
MYKLAAKVIDDVNSACAGSHLHSHGIYFHSAIASILDTHGAYAIKHRQHIEINSRKTGIITFHQLKRKYFTEWGSCVGMA